MHTHKLHHMSRLIKGSRAPDKNQSVTPEPSARHMDNEKANVKGRRFKQGYAIFRPSAVPLLAIYR